MRQLPVPTLTTPRTPTVYRAAWGAVSGVVAQVNGQVTFVSDAGVVREPTPADMRAMVVMAMVRERAAQQMMDTVFWWREEGLEAPRAPIA